MNRRVWLGISGEPNVFNWSSIAMVLSNQLRLHPMTFILKFVRADVCILVQFVCFVGKVCSTSFQLCPSIQPIFQTNLSAAHLFNFVLQSNQSSKQISGGWFIWQMINRPLTLVIGKCTGFCCDFDSGSGPFVCACWVAFIVVGDCPLLVKVDDWGRIQSFHHPSRNEIIHVDSRITCTSLFCWIPLLLEAQHTSSSNETTSSSHGELQV